MKINRWFAYAIFFGVLAWWRFNIVSSPTSDLYDNFIRDFALAVGCFVLFTALSQQPGKAVRGQKLHATMAGFSYTLYLVHMPLLIFIAVVMHDVFQLPFRQQPSAAGFLYAAILLVAVYAYGYLFSLMTEAHTERVRDWLRHRRQLQLAARSGR